MQRTTFSPNYLRARRDNLIATANMFFAKALLFGALAASAAAQSAVLTFTRVPNPITDGEPQAILYATNDTSTPVTIILRKGNPNDLQTVDVLTNDATNGQYIWTPPKSLPNGYDYALEIRWVLSDKREQHMLTLR